MSRVLIVDDEPYIRNLLKVYLRQKGYLVEAVSNGAAAIAAARGRTQTPCSSI